MKGFLAGLYSYGIVGGPLWILFGLPIFLVPFMGPNRFFEFSLNFSEIFVAELNILVTMICIGLATAWIIALLLLLGGTIKRDNPELGRLIGYKGPAAICLIAGMLQVFIIFPSYAPLASKIICGIIPVFFYPKSLITIASPLRKRLSDL